MTSHDQDVWIAVVLPFACAAILVGIFILWRPALLRRAFASPRAIWIVLAVDLIAAALLFAKGEAAAGMGMLVAATMLATAIARRRPVH